MKQILLNLLIIALLGVFGPALADLSLVEVSPIGFGLILPNAPASGGTVSIAKTNATRMVVSGNYVFAQTGTSGVYTITGGSASQHVNVAITTPGTIANGGGPTLVINNFTTNTDSGTATGKVTLDSSGEFQLQIGCNLTLGANQAAGTYSGQLDVTLSPG